MPERENKIHDCVANVGNEAISVDGAVCKGAADEKLDHERGIERKCIHGKTE